MRKYGVGILNNIKIPDQEIAIRNFYSHGSLSFHGFKSISSKKVYHIGSGRAGVYFGCPPGTYILSPQATASTIRRLYNYFGLRGPAFDSLYNVGIPGNITSTGYDPAVRRARTAIQFHAEPRLMSMGCITMTPSDFVSFINTAKIAEKEHKLDLVVSLPGKNGQTIYKIIPRI